MRSTAHLLEQQPATRRVAGPHWEAFDQWGRSAADPAWVRAARAVGMARFAQAGFPTVHDEDWRFTNVAALTKLPIHARPRPTPGAIRPEALDPLALAGLPGVRLVFVNGHFDAESSTTEGLPTGVKAMSLATALATENKVLQKYLFQIDNAGRTNVFAALNTAFFQDGAFIYVTAKQRMEQPVQLLFLSTGPDQGATAHPRNLIIANEESQLTVLENYASLSDAVSFNNAVTELFVADGAKVEHLKFQDESLGAFHMATVAAHFGRASNVLLHSIALGAKLSRTNIYTTLGGPGLECILNGLYLTRGEQLADKSKGVFHGRILVHPGAQKTDAKQTNKNLLLSDEATINTKPQLEIYADDVKCTHGATVGRLNEESLFYLRTRGLGLEAARRLLIHAFAHEIIGRIRCDPARQELDQFLWQRLEEKNPQPQTRDQKPET